MRSTDGSGANKWRTHAASAIYDRSGAEHGAFRRGVALLELVVTEAEGIGVLGHVAPGRLVEAIRGFRLDLDGDLDRDALVSEEGQDLVGDGGCLLAGANRIELLPGGEASDLRRDRRAAVACSAAEARLLVAA